MTRQAFITGAYNTAIGELAGSSCMSLHAEAAVGAVEDAELVQPEEVAAAVLFLASASAITGINIPCRLRLPGWHVVGELRRPAPLSPILIHTLETLAWRMT